jgi:hypothetical protein
MYLEDLTTKRFFCKQIAKLGAGPSHMDEILDIEMKSNVEKQVERQTC